MTDGHLSRPIVRAPYHPGPSARRVGNLPAMLTLLHVFTLGDGRRGEGVVSLHVAILSFRLETQNLAQAFSNLNQPVEAFHPPSQLSKIEMIRRS